MDNKRLKRVLIIKPSSLGDVIHALPVAAALKAAHPGVRIDWVIGSAYTDLLDGNPDVDRLIVFDRSMMSGPGRLKRLFAFVRELRRKRYDAVLDLQGLLRSGLMALACRSAVRVGFAGAREGAVWAYTERVRVPQAPMHAAGRCMLAAAALGIKNDSAASHGFRIAIGAAGREQAAGVLRDAGIGEGEPFVALAPGARWDTKRWPADNFIRLSNMLLDRRGVRSVFVGTRDDAAILGGAGETLLDPRAAAFGKTTLKGLAALLETARVLVTNDSGPMHIAAAVGTPTVALFGPTDPARTGPYGTGHAIISSDADCAPCFKKSCSDVVCLGGLKTEKVYEAVCEKLP